MTESTLQEWDNHEPDSMLIVTVMQHIVEMKNRPDTPEGIRSKLLENEVYNDYNAGGRMEREILNAIQIALLLLEKEQSVIETEFENILQRINEAKRVIREQLLQKPLSALPEIPKLPEWYEFSIEETLLISAVIEDIKKMGDNRPDDPDEVAQILLKESRYQRHLWNKKDKLDPSEIVYAVRIALALLKLFKNDASGGPDEFHHRLIEAKRLVDSQISETIATVRAPILTELAKT